MTCKLDNDAQKTSYALGMDIGASFRKLPIKIELECAIAGMQSVFNGEKPVIDREEFVALMQKFQQELRSVSEQHGKTVGEKNRKEQAEFLARNKAEEGIVTTDSGLQYQVIEPGTGDKPKADSVVRVHYTGRLLDENVFDSSVARNEPAEFPVNGVIAGWTEALQLMQVGSKYRLFIPADLAYGNRGAGELIGPDAMLIFDVELLDIVG